MNSEAGIRATRAKRIARRVAVIAAIILGVLVIAGAGLYILKPKTPRAPRIVDSVNDLERYLDRVVKAQHPPGLSVAVVKDGHIVYIEGFGIADRFDNEKATGDSVYHWWSMTKIPTAIAILQLHERGTIDIDNPVEMYLPFFRVSYKNSLRPDVSVRQVLNHSAGLSNAMPEMITWIHLDEDPAVNQTELVISKASDYEKLLFEPGSKTRYSNWGYMILGAIIEAVTDETYEDYIVNNILRPLDMGKTNFVYTSTMADSEAIGSQHVVDPYTVFMPILKLGYIIRERIGLRYYFRRIYNDQTAPSGLIGSVADVALLMIAYLEGAPILHPETYSLMNEPLTKLSDPGDSIQGLGWSAHMTGDGRRYLAHSGGGPGFATIMRVYPLERLGVVVMGNDSAIDRNTLADVVVEVGW